MKQSTVKMYLALACAVLFWGLSFLWTKEALRSFEVGTILFIRFAAVSFMLAVMVRVKTGGFGFQLKMQPAIFLTAFFEPFLYFLLETNSLKIIDASVASLIAATIPLFVFLVSVLTRRENLKMLSLLAVLGSFGGIYLLVLPAMGSSFLSQGSLGIILMFGAVITAVFYIISVNRIGQKMSTLVLTFYQMVYGMVLFTPLFICDIQKQSQHRIIGSSMVSLIALIFLSTLVAFVAYNYAIARLLPSQVSLYLNAVPVVTIIAAFLFINERLSIGQLGGAALVIVSLYASNLRLGKKT